MDNQLSRFNYSMTEDGRVILYNTISDNILVMDPDLDKLIQSHAEDVDALADIHPDLYQELKDKGFLVSVGEDEVRALIREWERDESDPENFYLIINPTLDCNLHCWYCYERHQRGSVMSEKVLETVKKLLTDKVCNTPLKNLRLSFFGGEPLLRFDNIVYPILLHADRLCKENGVRLIIDFTTNAVLLDDGKIERLKTFNDERLPLTFQVTLDGERDVHNRIRGTREGEPTYDLIVSHIKKLIRAKIFVIIRFNYTRHSIDSFADVIRDFEDLSEEERTYCRFDFHQVWQDGFSEMVEERKENVQKWFEDESLCVSSGNHLSNVRCYADSENSMVVNYTGDLFKCTARDFSKQNSEGQIDEDGNVVWNGRYRERMDLKHSNTFCFDCILFPICHGGCSQTKIDRKGANMCIYPYNKKNYKKMLELRIRYLLEGRFRSNP